MAASSLRHEGRSKCVLQKRPGPEGEEEGSPASRIRALVNRTQVGTVIDANGMEELTALIKQRELVLVYVHATWCSVCRCFGPSFSSVARTIGKGCCQLEPSRFSFVKVDGSEDERILHKYNVHVFPTLLLFIDFGVRYLCYPPKASREPGSIINFLQRAATTDSKLRKSLVIQERWMKCISAVIHQLRYDSHIQLLSGKRDFVTIVELFKALGCSDEESCSAATRSHAVGEDPPTCWMFGGGAGAGKSTVARQLAQTPFWQKHGSSVVAVEADALKTKDPIFLSLQQQGSDASAMVHEYSVKAASSLFLSAVRHRRDVVFDGTMAWLPFVQQTVDLLRDNHYHYRLGPGYVQNDKGELLQEVYWERDRPCKDPLVPYVTLLIGVYCDPEIAIQRAALRMLRTKRSVPLRSLLASHRRFAANFEDYVQMFDEVQLFENNTVPQLLARKTSPDHDVVICNEASYKKFLQLAELDEDQPLWQQLYDGYASLWCSVDQVSECLLQGNVT